MVLHPAVNAAKAKTIGIQIRVFIAFSLSKLRLWICAA